eukprot:TRINITY_DN5544_c0_g1_i1.p1 TRINITY_DN5544_c0_g1~~TRINITY_DN5544_c0_g1_i1.p1  ORF type:complete len:198 (+),score=30.29 TRINITY_DN5544_c0_g1_i1:45-596(+)
MSSFFLLCIVLAVLMLASDSYAAQCLCRCNQHDNLIPIIVDDCSACLATVCVANHEECKSDFQTQSQVIVTHRCVEVDPCPDAFEASLCVNDREPSCIDASGRAPWEVSCKCARLSVGCLGDRQCPISDDEKALCVAACSEQECTYNPKWADTIDMASPSSSDTSHNSVLSSTLALATLLIVQ